MIYCRATARMLKLYYIAPMFRRERPQKGRYRQHVQAGVEVLSNTDNPAIESEVLEMLLLFLGRVGLQDLVVNPRLVRGFDYYMRTTFEITSGRLGVMTACRRISMGRRPKGSDLAWGWSG